MATSGGSCTSSGNKTNGGETRLPAVNFGSVVNSGFGDDRPTLSGDGLTLFGSDRPGNVPGSGSNVRGLDLWMTTRSDPHNQEGWGEPVSLAPWSTRVLPTAPAGARA